MDRVLIGLREAELRRAKNKEWAADICDGVDDDRAVDLRFEAARHRACAEALTELLGEHGVVFVPPTQPALFERMH